MLKPTELIYYNFQGTVNWTVTWKCKRFKNSVTFARDSRIITSEKVTPWFKFHAKQPHYHRNFLVILYN